jgi:hypothetical protein
MARQHCRQLALADGDSQLLLQSILCQRCRDHISILGQLDPREIP